MFRSVSVLALGLLSALSPSDYRPASKRLHPNGRQRIRTVTPKAAGVRAPTYVLEEPLGHWF